MSTSKRGPFRKPDFIGTQTSQGVNIKKQITKMNKTKIVAGAFIYQKTGGLYNTYHELLSQR